MEKPEVVTPEEWQRARDDLLKAEKEATRALDALAARRRRLPMVKVDKEYAFDTDEGTKSLADLFDGRDELVVYQFMDNGPDDYCPGCTSFTNNVTDLASLNARGISWATVSNMPLTQIQSYKRRMDWTMPFVSSRGTSFADDCGAGGGFMLTVFIKDEAGNIHRTYNTTQRGVDRLKFDHNIMDLTPYGRMQDWEDSPEGWPQHTTYG